jgi:hypothetical protein
MIRNATEFVRAKFSWTMDRVDLLEQMRNEGNSAQLIADELGTSRGSVIGKLDRMGLLGVRVTQARKPIVRLVIVKPEPDPQPPRGTPTPLSAAKALEQAQTVGGCLFGYGDPRDDNFRFCCEPKHKVSSYCEKHYARCHKVTESYAAVRDNAPTFFQRGWDDR